jgi:hypothetical protein
MVYLGSSSPKTTDLKWGEHHVFDSPAIFFRAVREAGLAQFNGLTPEEKNTVYGLIYSLAGKPQTVNLQWGEHNAQENLTRLFDAVAMNKK